MAWQMIDDLTGDVVPADAAHRLSLVLDLDGQASGPEEIASWDVASTDPRQLLAQLGEHLAGVAAPLSPDPDSLHVFDLHRIGVSVTPSYAAAVARGLERWVRARPYSVCPHDPDGQHFPDCGCDDVDPVDPNGTPAAVEESAGDQPADVHDEPSSQVNASESVDESAGNVTPAVRTGEAENGRATDAQVRAWCAAHKVPCSTHGKLNHSAREAYEAAHQTSSSPLSGDETPPSSDPIPPAGRAAADQTSVPVGTSAPTGTEGDPPPGTTLSGRAAGPATTETPEHAARVSEDPSAPAPAGEGGAGAARVAVTAIGDGGSEDLEAHAEELLSAKRTPREVASATGLSLEQVRAISQDMRRRS